MTAPEHKKIKASDIVPPQMDIRSTGHDDQIKELADSIQELGLIEPIVVSKKGKKYEIVAGHRRFQAMTLLGYDFMDCRIVTADNETLMMMKVHENIHRLDITTLEEAHIVGFLHYEHNKEPKEIARSLKRSESWVCDRLDILAQPDDIKALLQEGKIKLGVLRELIRVKDAGVRAVLIDNAVRGGVSLSTARQWRQDYESVQVPATPEATEQLAAGILPPVAVPVVRCFLCDSEAPPHHMHAPCLCGACYSGVLKEKAGAR